MEILIIDGQGGQLGARLVKEISEAFPAASLTAIGTNAIATTAMLKAGAKKAATGENPTIVAARKADVIVGPLGIVIADALLGEITEKMAVAIGRADAVRILIPMNKCDNVVAGVSDANTSVLVGDAISRMREIVAERGL